MLKKNNMIKSSLWQSFQKKIINLPKLGISIDTTMMKKSDNIPHFLEKLFANAFREMHKLEKGNIANPDFPEELINFAISKYNSLDILVNCAGIAASIKMENYDDESLKKMIDINFKSVFRLCRQSIIKMKNQKEGCILNIGSMSGIVSNFPQPQVAYNASKSAVHMLTKSLASDYAEFNIRVNAIAPGYIKTPMNNLPKENEHWFDKWNNYTPMGRMGNADEVATAALFLCSPASSYVTGEVLVVDGGYTSR